MREHMFEPSAVEIRAVPLDEMLEWYRGQVEQSSLRQVARWCEVGHSTLHNILSCAKPHPRVRRLLAIAYLRERGKETPGLPEPPSESIHEADEPDEPDAQETAALETLLGPLAPVPRAFARRMILCILEGIYIEAGCEVPLWITSGRDGCA